ncbi:MAG: hypothetical protein LBU39_02245 [Desulfobulbaceae bacterium]|jgi:hypothetical protein|nr:hypothetical protein [Desulfobulbaceae bacterium]
MDFCVDCGGALNLFETNDDGLCPRCRRVKEKDEARPAALNADDILLHCQENACHLLQADGQLLFSLSAGRSIPLAEAIASARRIQAIRRNHPKN